MLNRPRYTVPSSSFIIQTGVSAALDLGRRVPDLSRREYLVVGKASACRPRRLSEVTTQIQGSVGHRPQGERRLLLGLVQPGVLVCSYVQRVQIIPTHGPACGRFSHATRS